MREVVAAGLDPRRVRLREIAEPPNSTLDAGLALDEALPLPRGARPRARPGRRGGRTPRRRPLARRRAAAPRRGRAARGRARARLSRALAAGVGAGRRRALFRLRQLGGGERGAVEQVALADADRVEAVARRGSRRRIAAPATITGARSGSSAGTRRRSASGSAASRSSCARAPSRVRTCPCTRARSYRSSPRSSAASVVIVAGDADRASCRARAPGSARTGRAALELLPTSSPWRSVSRTSRAPGSSGSRRGSARSSRRRCRRPAFPPRARRRRAASAPPPRRPRAAASRSRSSTRSRRGTPRRSPRRGRRSWRRAASARRRATRRCAGSR